MFNWPAKVQFLRDNPRYNNAESYGVKIIAKENANWVVSVHKLTPDENDGLNHAFFDVYCVQGGRQIHRAINWGWAGMSQKQKNETTSLFPDKPLNEIPALRLGAGQIVWMEIASGDRVKGIHTGHDDELKEDGINYGNTRFHHSFLVVWQEVDKSGSKPPEPSIVSGNVQVTVNKDWINMLPVDEQENVTFSAEIVST